MKIAAEGVDIKVFIKTIAIEKENIDIEIAVVE